MKLKTLLVVALTTLALSLSAESAYQKKLYQIYEKYYTLFKDGHSHGLNMTESIVFAMDPEAMTALATMSALEWFPINELNLYIKQMERELAQAESLMTPEERKAKAQKDAIKARQNTSVGYLEMTIQAKLMQWAVKGEFEKTTDYQKRLQEEGDSLFAATCRDLFPESSFDVKPLKYDADSEKYDFEIQYRLRFGGKSFTHKCTATIPIDVNAARYLNQNTPDIKIVDYVWGEFENNITPQSYNITINEKSYWATTKVADLIVFGTEVFPDIAELQSLSYNYSELRRQRIQNKAHLLAEIEKYNNRMIKQDSINQYIIKSSPYYRRLPEYMRKDFIQSYKPRIFTEDDDIVYIEEYYNEIQINNEQFSNTDPLLPIKQYLKQNDRHRFVEAYFEEHPDSAQFLKKEWLEYQCICEFQYIQPFVIAYLDGKVDSSKRKCREYTWNRYSKYYESKNAFDADYDKGIQTIEKHARLCETLDTKVNDIKTYLNMPKVSSMNLQGANNNHNEHIENIVKLYNELTDNSIYQEKAASVIIDESEKTQKEYVKNGNLFTSKAEFITAYFNSNYKKILKSKK